MLVMVRKHCLSREGDELPSVQRYLVIDRKGFTPEGGVVSVEW